MDDLKVIHTYLETHASQCFTLLYDRYIDLISRRCLTLLGNEDEAKDAAQEIFVKILTSLSRFQQRSSFSTWIYSITYNFCMDKLRKRKRDPVAEYEIPEIGEEKPTVSDEEIYSMEVNALKWVLQRINENDKAILVMKYYDDMSIKEIGSILNKSDSAIKMQLKRAKEKAQKLRKQYQEQQQLAEGL